MRQYIFCKQRKIVEVAQKRKKDWYKIDKNILCLWCNIGIMLQSKFSNCKYFLKAQKVALILKI
mgnify:FL=1